MTAIAYGTDGMQVELRAGDTLYSVTISVIQARVFGRMDQIEEGSELVVSGPIVAGVEPPSSHAHTIYLGLELLKIGLLFVLGFRSLAGRP